MIVIDASVAMKWFVPENLHDEARCLLRNRSDFRAPDLILVEVANAAWKKAARNEITGQHLRAIVDAIPQFIPALVPASALLAQATELAAEFSHSVYDCLYLACAEEADDVVVTANRRFFEKLRNTRIADRIRFLDDPRLYLPLRIPLNKLDDIIGLLTLAETTRQSISKAFDTGEEFRFLSPEELGLHVNSPAIRRMLKFFESLSRDELIDVLAVGWLGQGYSGTDWRVIRERAGQMIGRYENQSYRYVLGLSCYLDRGLSELRRLFARAP